MTTISEVDDVRGDQRGAAARQPLLRRMAANPAVVALSLGLAALGLRLYQITRSYNLFIDEVSYTTIARNLATGHGVTLYNGEAFDLHPPFAFALLALYGKATSAFGMPMEHLAFALRPLSATWGALAVVFVYLLLRRSSVGPRGAFVAGCLLAIDPFALLFDSRVMLEAQSQALVVLTLVCYVSAARSERHRIVFLLAAGLTGGMALCTKETFGLVLMLTLGLLILAPRVLPRRDTLLVAGVALVGYGVSVVSVGLSTGFGHWWHARTDGLGRLVGTTQITGFNAPTTHVSLASRLAANLAIFGVTYVVLIAGGIAAVVLVLRRRLWRRELADGSSGVDTLILAWTLASGLYLTYATILGSIEAQMYYITLAPTLVTLVLAGRGLWSGRGQAVRGILAALLLMGIGWNAKVWVQTHREDNNAYRQMVIWGEKHVPAGTTISVTDSISQFIILDANLGEWATVDSIREHHADLVVFDTNLVEQGYALGRPDFLEYVEAHGTKVFSARDHLSGGDLVVYDVRAITGGSR